MTDSSSPAPRVAVTGAAGFLGQGLIRRLAGDGTALVAVDVRAPDFRPGNCELHLVDLTQADLRPVLEGVDTVVHLAGVHDAVPDGEFMARVNVTATRRLLEAAATAGVRKVVLASSAAVYGAWANNPIPLTEDAPMRPNPGNPLGVHKAEAERLLAGWAAGSGASSTARVATVLRPACVLGPRADHAVARLVRAGLPVAVAGAGAPVQFIHEDDAVEALALAVERDLPGVYNVAAEGWIGRAELASLTGRRVRAALPPELVERILRRLWPAGVVDLPPGMLPYFVHPWVVAVDRLRAEGWTPRHSNEETVLATVDRRSPVLAPMVGGAVAAGAGLVVAGLLTRRRRRR